MFLYFFMIIMVLTSVAFLTLFERKLMAYSHIRKGPNKIFIKGIFQPFSDAIKLFMKENNSNYNLNKYMFNMFPFLALFLALFSWFIFVFKMMNEFFYSCLFFLLISSLNIYWLLGSGWSSNSKYGLLGSYRSGAQMISYEVGMIFLILCLLISNMNLNLTYHYHKSNLCPTAFYFLWYLFIIWIITMMAELNRTPFDFSESESELVSGFNIEYGASKFILLFLAEYSNIMFISYLTFIMFMFSSYFFYLFIIMLIIWARISLPRFRYDTLMYLNWKIFLPFILFLFYFLLLFQFHFIN